MEVSKDNSVYTLNPCGEDDVTGTLYLSDLARKVADISDGELGTDDEAEEDAEKKLLNLALQLEALTLVCSILDSHRLLSSEARKTLFRYHRASNVEKTRRLN